MSQENPIPPSRGWEQVESCLPEYAEADIRRWQAVRLEQMILDPSAWSSTERSLAAQINAVLLLLDAARAAEASQIEEAIEKEGDRIATAVFEATREIGIDANDTDGSEESDPVFHLIGWIRGLVERQQAQVAALSAQVEKGEKHEREAWLQVEELRGQIVIGEENERHLRATVEQLTQENKQLWLVVDPAELAQLRQQGAEK